MSNESDPGPSAFISVAEAIQILDAAVVTPRVQRVRLADAHGLRLADQISADRDYPPFDKAVMDGFAVRAADVTKPGVQLRIVETIAAGAATQRELGAGEAMAIMTGAPLPSGADAVVPVEETSRDGGRVTINCASKIGAAIARRGSDVEANRVVLPKGVRLGPAQLAVAASVGAAEVSVFARPRVKILSSGDELVPFDQPAGPTQIRESNAIMLTALLERLGCEVVHAGHIRDELAEVERNLKEHSDADALFISGGMSMGQFDYVPQALARLGAKPQISKLRIKPGKPFLYTQLQACHVFGLPGNPVSGFVCTVRLAARILRRLGGGTPDATIGAVKLASPLPANGSREFYQPALRMGASVEPLEWKGSADIYTLATANALIIRPEDAPPAVAGESVPVIDLAN